MTLGDASRMFFLCYYFFLFVCRFYLTQNPQGYYFWLVPLGYLVFIEKLKEKWIQFLNILFLIQPEKR